MESPLNLWPVPEYFIPVNVDRLVRHSQRHVHLYSPARACPLWPLFSTNFLAFHHFLSTLKLLYIFSPALMLPSAYALGVHHLGLSSSVGTLSAGVDLELVADFRWQRHSPSVFWTPTCPPEVICQSPCYFCKVTLSLLLPDLLNFSVLTFQHQQGQGWLYVPCLA